MMAVWGGGEGMVPEKGKNICHIYPGNSVYYQHEQGYKMQVHIKAHFVV